MKRVHHTERKKNSVDPQDSVHRLCRSDSHALSDNCRNDGLGRAETHQGIKRHPMRFLRFSDGLRATVWMVEGRRGARFRTSHGQCSHARPYGGATVRQFTKGAQRAGGDRSVSRVFLQARSLIDVLERCRGLSPDGADFYAHLTRQVFEIPSAFLERFRGSRF
jgi:hypothetical protein